MTEVAVTIRPLQADDRAAWDPLWAGYLRFYRHELPAEVTDRAFASLAAGEDGLSAFVAVDQFGNLVGFAHLVEHRSTWSATSTLYLEDLFVDITLRGSGIARALIAEVYAEADRRACDRTYWITEEFNIPGRRLYEVVASRKSYVMYER